MAIKFKRGTGGRPPVKHGRVDQSGIRRRRLFAAPRAARGGGTVRPPSGAPVLKRGSRTR